MQKSFSTRSKTVRNSQAKPLLPNYTGNGSLLMKTTTAQEMNQVGLMKVRAAPYGRSVQIVKGTKGEGAGQLGFAVLDVAFHKRSEDQFMRVQVIRSGGFEGQICCAYAAEAGTALNGYDYELTSGILFLADGAADALIEVLIKAKPPEKRRNSLASEAIDEGLIKGFRITLSECDTSSMEDVATGVDAKKSDCTLRISDVGLSGHIAGAALEELQLARAESAIGDDDEDDIVTYSQQFVKALRPVNGDESDAVNATSMDWAIHLAALPWKLLFAFVPPVHYLGGWGCFFVALSMIGFITAFVADWASALGCVLGLPDSVTAVTIVALGTSLPDAFASKVAAVEDPTADNAVGNVTGSNAVNVFLGLGLPWTMAALFWASEGATAEWVARFPDMAAKYPNGGFVVRAGDLTFSVIVFVITALLAICLLLYRRHAVGAELGGPVSLKTTCAIFFVLLWVYYVSLASWKAVVGEVDTVWLAVMPIAGFICVLITLMVISASLTCHSRREVAKNKALTDIVTDMTKVQQAGMKMMRPAPKKLTESVASLKERIATLSRWCEKLEVEAAKAEEEHLEHGEAAAARMKAMTFETGQAFMKESQKALKKKISKTARAETPPAESEGIEVGMEAGSAGAEAMWDADGERVGSKTPVPIGKVATVPDDSWRRPAAASVDV
jgi:Ca2+/Na+ antiporter